MANENDTRQTPTTRQQPFTLYAANGRIYAQNIAQKVIDLGALERMDSGGFRYMLDGNHETGEGFFTEETALQEIADKMRFLWLDGQFTAVADAREGGELNLQGATRLDITLDELKPGERMYDATV
jgi:hypothetical protein